VDVTRCRAETPGCRSRIHLNNAGASLMPEPVLARVLAHLELEREIGGYEAAEEAGDRIITSQSEYCSNYIAYLHLAKRKGVEVVVAANDGYGQLDVRALRQVVSSRTKLISISHVPTSGGLVNAAAEVGRVAQMADVPFLLDACQSVGQMPIDVRDIGLRLPLDNRTQVPARPARNRILIRLKRTTRSAHPSPARGRVCILDGRRRVHLQAGGQALRKMGSKLRARARAWSRDRLRALAQPRGNLAARRGTGREPSRGSQRDPRRNDVRAGERKCAIVTFAAANIASELLGARPAAKRDQRRRVDRRGHAPGLRGPKASAVSPRLTALLQHHRRDHLFLQHRRTAGSRRAGWAVTITALRSPRPARSEGLP